MRSSRALSTLAICPCSASGGTGSSKSGMSLHRKLSNTAPTFMYLPTSSHHSVPLTSQRKYCGMSFLPSARKTTKFWPIAHFSPAGTWALSPELQRRTTITSFAWGDSFFVQSV